MSVEPTVPQDDPDRRRSQELSLQPGVPPAHVPGYDLERLLGVGAYGEVWVAVERNTGRRVAIKFYAHRGGLDWSLLSREVEKLAFLFADRYVVQLIGVGWESDPPYYIMEYLEHGSLAEQVQQGAVGPRRAVEIVHDVALGLAHAHSKGVLHCDLKPANVLLDQDGKPRLADFGQSRLSHEQAPALGTLFYMAPEQADLAAVPDARWDVYALGALFYCMLTGQPPYKSEAAVADLERAGNLDERLALYRRAIRRAPPPTAHRRIRGVDRHLAAIIDGCLAVDPQKRFPNVQGVLDALAARAVRRARRPLLILGALLPLVLLTTVGLFARWGFNEVLQRADDALSRRALESNHFAAQYVARALATELETRWRSVEQLAGSSRVQTLLREAAHDPNTREMFVRLSDPETKPSELERLQAQYRGHSKRKVIQTEFEELIAARQRPEAKAWVLSDARGLQLARSPEKSDVVTIGRNFAWRSYFSGLPADLPPTRRPEAGQRLRDTMLSPVYFGHGSNRWLVAISTPVVDEDNNDEFLGVVAMVMELGRFGELKGTDEQFGVLVDWRDGDNKGVVLQHPLFDRLIRDEGSVPDRFRQHRVTHAELPASPERMRHYADPFAADPAGEAYRKHWLAQMEPVMLRDKDTGWIIIIQESHDSAIGASLDDLRRAVARYGLTGLAAAAVVLAGLWALAWRMWQDTSAAGRPAADGDTSAASSEPSQPPHPNAPTETF